MITCHDKSRFPALPTAFYLCYECERPVQGSEAVHGSIESECIILCKECAREAGP